MGSLEISVFLFGRNDSFGAIFKSFGLISVVFLKPTCVEYLFVGLLFFGAHFLLCDFFLRCPVTKEEIEINFFGSAS